MYIVFGYFVAWQGQICFQLSKIVFGIFCEKLKIMSFIFENEVNKEYISEGHKLVTLLEELNQCLNEQKHNKFYFKCHLVMETRVIKLKFSIFYYNF